MSGPDFKVAFKPEFHFGLGLLPAAYFSQGAADLVRRRQERAAEMQSIVEFLACALGREQAQVWSLLSKWCIQFPLLNDLDVARHIKHVVSEGGDV